MAVLLPPTTASVTRVTAASAAAPARLVVLAAAAYVPLAAPVSSLLPGPRPIAVLVAHAPVILALALFAYGRQRFLRPHPLLPALVAAYVVLFTVGAIRHSLSGTVWSEPVAIAQAIAWASVAAFATLTALHSSRGREAGSAWLAMLAAPVVYVTANVLLHVVGWSSLQITSNSLNRASANTTLALFGVDVERVTFPLAESPNVLGVLAGAAFAITLPLLWLSGKHRVSAAAAVGLAVSLYGLVASDTRGALIAAAGAVGGALLLRGRWRRLLVVPSLLLPISALLMTRFAELVGASAAGTAVSRSGSGDVTTGRTEIWRPILAFLEENPLEHTFGYGIFGHRATGLSEAYAHVFERSSPEAQLMTSAHNLGLQTVLDFGWLGLVIVTALSAVAVWRLASEPRTAVASATLAGLVFFSFEGWTESRPAIYGGESLATWLLLLAIAIAITGRARPVADGAGMRRQAGWSRLRSVTRRVA